MISNSALHILEEETEANTMKQLSQKHADRPDTEGTMLIVMLVNEPNICRDLRIEFLLPRNAVVLVAFASFL